MEETTNKGFGFGFDRDLFPQPQHNHHVEQLLHPQVSPEMMVPSSSSSAASSSVPSHFMVREGGGGSSGGAYEFGELDQAFFLYLDGQDATSTLHRDQKQCDSSMRPTLDIFPSQPMHVDPSKEVSPAGMIEASRGVVPKRESAVAPSMELGNEVKDAEGGPPHQLPPKVIKREGKRKGLVVASAITDGPRTLDPKVLRRLAQNREAARKSRLRKKAYVQQLESSRIRLSQLEQELQRARSQGAFFGGGGALLGGDQSGVFSGAVASASVFDMQYARWMEEHHRRICELRSAAEDHVLSENDLRPFVDNCVAHYDEEMNLRFALARSDVFYLMSGMWTSPAERCFLWIGGFRPSRLIKIVVNQLEPLPEQQLMGILGLQQSTHEAEESLSQGLEGLNRSLSDTIASDSLLEYPTNMSNFMGHMALAINKLSALEALVGQADNLRHQTIHRLYHLLTTQQAATSVLAISEYSHRLRALSSLWLSRP
ncbi:hypothetical protein MLD38_015938 [Melastoma candidum]|uniref:Uncharacterized protein n=1 Tax=Melastoma candidum TaxID=119954 RepID=A0ACB9RHV3_9MYRT|nr:hypothetical protein MLD38_015938 [Melastoma candidum]